MSPPVLLASKSSARRAVLTGAGVPFEAVGSGVDEEALKADMLAEGTDAAAIAVALADAKALAVSKQRPGLVIGADQTLEFEGGLYDKVDTLAEAAERLRLLRGKPHRLHAAVTVAEAGEIVWRDLQSAELVMRDFTDAFINAYLAQEGDEALGSVGCYRLEALGAQLFETIEGDYFAILGLPLLSLLDLLRERKVLQA